MTPSCPGGPPPLGSDWPTGAIVLCLLAALAVFAAAVSK